MAVADGFPAPPEWSLVEAHARGRGPFCIDVECPNAYRRWETVHPLSDTELEALIQRAGWRQIRIDGNCQPQPNRTGTFPLCTAFAAADGLVVEVSVAGPMQSPRPYQIVLSVTD